MTITIERRAPLSLSILVALLASGQAGCGGQRRPPAAPGAAPVGGAAPAMAKAMEADEPMPAASAAGVPRAAERLSDVNTDAALVTDASVIAIARPFLSTASGFRREVYRLGGRVFAEAVRYETGRSGDEVVASATYRVKLQPHRLPELLDWLASRTTITTQNVASTIAVEAEGDAAIVRADVVARVAAIDAELATAGLLPAQRTALEAERAGLVPSAIGDPGAAAGATKRVAVLGVVLSTPPRRDPLGDGRRLAHLRGSSIGLDAPGGISDGRFGIGIGVGGRSPVSTVEVTGYAGDATGTAAGLLATLGLGTYLEAFGDGGRSALTPFVGVRAGYAYLEASHLAIAGELGIELVKQHGVVVMVSVRPIGLFGRDSQAAIEGGGSLALSF